MRITPEGIFMTATAYIERARGWARRIEDGEAEKSGLPLPEVRPVVARHLGISPGTLENLRKGRLKAIAVHVYDRLRAGVIRQLEAEVRHLEHELHILRQTGVDPRDHAIEAVVADFARVRAALGLPASGGSEA